MAHGAPADERLGDFGHFYGGKHPGVNANLLERILESQGVDDGGQHAHVVGNHAVQLKALAAAAAPDVAAAHHDADLDFVFVGCFDFVCDLEKAF